jgi:hypothetical protein
MIENGRRQKECYIMVYTILICYAISALIIALIIAYVLLKGDYSHFKVIKKRKNTEITIELHKEKNI